MDVRVRGIEESDWPAVHRVVHTVFGFHGSTAHADQEAELIPTARVLAVDDGDEVVGTAAAYSFELTLPGATIVPAAGVTNVGVLPTHRRRGILRALMERQLDDVVAAGEPLAVLDASEAAIYGRFGYGLASRYSVWRIPVARAHLARPAPSRRVRLVPQAEAAGLVAAAFDAARRVRPGQVSRPGTPEAPDRWSELLVGSPDVETWKVGGQFFVAVVDPEGDDPGGYALYRLQEGGDAAGAFTLYVRELVAARDDTAAALWSYLLGVDLVGSITTDAVPIDDPLPWRLTDHRAVRVTEQRDYLFARVLDVPGVLGERRYAADVDVVLEVHDERPAVAGRWRVQGGPDGASCERAASAEPDLVLGAAELGSLALGDVGPSLLVAAGRLEARSTAAARRADLAFRSTPAPFCATRF